MTPTLLQAGIMPGFFSIYTLDAAVDQLQKFPQQPVDYGICHGVGPEHLAYLWFKRTFLLPVMKQMDMQLTLSMGMLVDINRPFGIHSDLKHVPRTPALSFLIPVSVDHGAKDITMATTDVFEETDDGIAPPENPTLKLQAQWNKGDVIWWDTCLLHSSGTFNGFANKQAIVMHAYV